MDTSGERGIIHILPTEGISVSNLLFLLSVKFQLPEDKRGPLVCINYAKGLRIRPFLLDRIEYICALSQDSENQK